MPSRSEKYTRRSDTRFPVGPSNTGVSLTGSGYGSSDINPYDLALIEGNYRDDPWEWITGKQARSLLAKSADLDAEVYLMNLENEYNSPLNQAIRMRQAGLNPDLQGVSQHTAASGSAPSATPDLGGVSEVVNFFAIAFSIIKGGFGIFKNMQEAQQIGAATENILTETAINEEKAKLYRQEVIKRSFSNIEDLTGYVSRTAATFFPETLQEYFSYLDSDDFKKAWELYLSNGGSESDFAKFAEENKFPALKLNFDNLGIFPEEVLPGANNILQQLVTQRSETLRNDLYSVLGRSASTRTDFIQTTSDPYYGDSDLAMTDLWVGYYTMLRDLAKITGENQLTFQQSYEPSVSASTVNAENAFQSEFYDSLDADIIGLSKNESSRSSFILHKYHNDVESVMTQFSTELSGRIREMKNPITRTMALMLLQQVEKMRVTLEESFYNNVSTATDASKAIDLVSGISDVVF